MDAWFVWFSFHALSGFDMLNLEFVQEEAVAGGARRRAPVRAQQDVLSPSARGRDLPEMQTNEIRPREQGPGGQREGILPRTLSRHLLSPLVKWLNSGTEDTELPCIGHGDGVRRALSRSDG